MELDPDRALRRTASKSNQRDGPDSLAKMIINDERSSRSWFYGDDFVPDVCSIKDANATADAVSMFRHCSSVDSAPTGLIPKVVPLNDKGSMDTVTSELVDVQAKQRHRLRTWYSRWCKDWWALEVGSMFLGTICIIIIAIMLLQVDGDEMPKWKLGITIDAILSLLSGFSKSCLLMPTAEALGQIKWTFGITDKRRAVDIERIDKASRGTWGSVVLLVRARGVTLASLGAAIILLSLPLDLCFQQIVRYPVEQVLQPAVNASIARSVSYNPPRAESFRQNSLMMSEDDQIASFLYTSWSTNVYDGPEIRYFCPTGNCTFEPFHSLAVDFQCQALPPAIAVRDCRNTSAEWDSTVLYKGPFTSPNKSSCGFYLDVPNHQPQLLSGYEIDTSGSIGEVLSNRVMPLTDLMTNEPYFNPNGSIRFSNVKSRIIDFVLSSTPGGFEGVRANRTPVIEECEIHWVVKRIQAGIRNGILEESTLDTLPFDTTEPHWDPTDPDVYMLSPSLRLPDANDPTGYSSYGLSNVTARKVWQAWALFVPSTFLQTSNDSPIGKQNVMKVTWLASDVHLARIVKPTLPWDYPSNVTAHISGMVNALNQVLRRNALSEDGKRDVALGQVWRNAVMVRVNWAWFAFPAALWFIAFAFLSVTIWRSSQASDGSGTYKSSLLPLLLSPDRDGRSVLAPSRNMGSVQRLAKKATVQLRTPQE